MAYNRILDADSYKLSHFAAYPKEVDGMAAYIEARKPDEIIVFFGLSMWIKKTLLAPIEPWEIDEAEAFAAGHGVPFNRADWDYLLEKYGGFLPIVIKAVPEGTRVTSKNVLCTIECTDKRLYWLVSYIETSLQRAIWYPTSIASNDYKNWRSLRRFLLETATDLTPLAFGEHDFGGRGVSSEETAQIGGAGHTVYFMGSDTISGVRAANFYYHSNMSAFSVAATEHSIQCSFGPMRQRDYIEHVIKTYAKPGAIVSIVLDGYDIYRETALVGEFRDQIIASGCAKFVIRPDSGDALEVIPQVLKILEASFGTKLINGFKVLNNVGVLQGDGINHDSMVAILEKITSLGWSSSNIVFGSGGALLQKVDRDTYGFAQKTVAVRVKGAWHDVFKDPITDAGKKSKRGRLMLLKSKLTGEYMTVNVNEAGYGTEWDEALFTVYENGKLLVDPTLDEIRARAQA
jgi:nicotinamide phosphoribosyltransferase